MMNVSDLLSSIYYNKKNSNSFSSQEKLYKAARKFNTTITRDDVRKWWTTQLIPSRCSQAKKKYLRATFVTREPHYTYLSDLADFSKLYKNNKNYRWLVVIQDLFSRKLIVLVAQKSKTSKETAKSLENVFSLRAPKKFLTDKGGEYMGECKDIYKKFSITHYTTNDVTQKVAPVERAILVIKQRLFKIMRHENTLTWIDKLDDVMNAYNSSYNRVLEMSPNDAEKPENQSKVFYNVVTKKENKNRNQLLEYKYEVGQIVRILRDQTYLKSYKGNYSNMLYKIAKREKKTGVPVYSLTELLTGDPISGTFYTQELKPVNIDESKLPEVAAIHGVRLENEDEQVLVSFKADPKKRHWIYYDNLIPYNSL